MKTLFAASLLAVCACTAQALAAPSYTPAGAVALGAPDRWDYVVADAGRVYVAHSDRLAVIDGRRGALIGEVTGIAGGTHGTGIAAGKGYTDDGHAGLAIAFDLKTLQVLKRIPADLDADGIVSDPATGHIFVIEGDPMAVSVIDPATDAVVATIKAGEKLEYGASDGRGSIYLAGEEKGDMLRVDAHLNAVTARWPTPGCISPHGLAVDAGGRRVFMSCANARMMVVDADSGTLIANLPIGRGSDAVAFDSRRRRVFSSDGLDGVVTVYQEVTPNRYEALEPVPTKVSGRTMSVDPQTGRLFVAAADTDPSPTPGGRPRPRPGTLKLLMFDPVP